MIGFLKKDKRRAVVPFASFVVLIIIEIILIGILINLSVESGNTYLEILVYISLIIFITGFIPRTFYAISHAFSNFMKLGCSANVSIESGTILPSQSKVVDQIWAAVVPSNSDRLRAGNIVPLKGDWGSGKSTALQYFLREATESPIVEEKDRPSRPKIVTIYFDAFANEAYPLLEFALFRTVAANWRILWPYGWLAVPVLRQMIISTPLTLKLSLKQGNATADVETKMNGAKPPQVLWHANYCRLIEIALHQYSRVVVIVDELDRCSPEVAQKYVTLIRRFLVVPGVSVIVPYVREQIRFKVFNPLKTELPDLAGTSQAVLWEFFGDAAIEDLKPPKKSESKAGISPAADDAERSKKSEKDCCCVNLVVSNADTKKPEGGAPSNSNIRESLIKSFLEAPIHTREAVLRKMEEKYLLDDVIVMPELSAEDFAFLVCANPKMTEIVTRTFCDTPLDGEFDITGAIIPEMDMTMYAAFLVLWSNLKQERSGFGRGQLCMGISIRAMNGKLNSQLSLLVADLPKVNIYKDRNDRIEIILSAIVMAVKIVLQMIAAEKRSP